MTPERFRQVEAVFDAAADAPSGEVAGVLDRLCEGDAPLRAEVLSLLAAAESAPTQIQDVIGRAASSAVEAAPRSAPRRIGPYRLVCELGRGGMGAVHLAVRDDDEYRTAVAIKLLHGGLETAEAVARFRDERQILASLEHANIVRLLEGGSTEDRLPYLVMEHVVGAPITEWVESRNASVRARVELFRKVCAAVTYAHQKLVVHRDLKPSNILVTIEGEPKLLDFGIAKLLDPAAGREASTRTGMRLLTPEYASPEQIRGEPVSTSGDVYALGAVLYELLSGAPAQRMKGEGLEALRALLEEDPPRPSTVAPAARRRAIAGDLDHIVMKALRKEVHERYASVEQLSEDLLRYLEGLPVLARAGTWSYRVGKLVRRSRGVIAVVAVVLVSLSTATVVSLRQARRADEQARRADEQARRAQKRFDEVRRLANSMLFEVDGTIEKLEGATQARELIVRRALEYLDGLASDAEGDTALLRELAVAYTKTGEIQGSALAPSLGRPKDALASYQKAKRILDGLLATGHRDTVTTWARARALFGIGEASRLLNELGPAHANALAAVELVSTLPKDDTFDYGVAARGYAQLFNLEMEDDELALTRVHIDGLLELATRWSARDAAPQPRYWLGIAREARGGLFAVAGDPDSAVPELRAAASIFGALSAEHPENAPYRRETWFAHAAIATALAGVGDAKIWMPSVVDLAGAEAEQREALGISERIARRDTGDSRAALELATTIDVLAAIVSERDAGAAVPLFERARDLFAALPASFRASNYAAQFERFGQCAMAVSLATQKRRADAMRAIERGIAVATESSEAEGASFEDRLGPLMCRYQAARALLALGQVTEATGMLQQVSTGLGTVLAGRPKNVLPYVGLVDTLGILARVQPDRRCALLAQAAATLGGWPAAPTAYLGKRLAKLHQELGDCPK